LSAGFKGILSTPTRLSLIFSAPISFSSPYDQRSFGQLSGGQSPEPEGSRQHWSRRFPEAGASSVCPGVVCQVAGFK
jgi:hypothetical protein